jgi:hypothetical protein
MIPIDEIRMGQWCHLLEGALQQSDNEIDLLRKAIGWFYLHAIMMDIYWRGFSTIRKGTWPFTKGHRSILLDMIVMVFIQGSSSSIRDGIWSFTKGTVRFYLHWVVMALIESELFLEQRKNMTIY